MIKLADIVNEIRIEKMKKLHEGGIVKFAGHEYTKISSNLFVGPDGILGYHGEHVAWNEFKDILKIAKKNGWV